VCRTDCAWLEQGGSGERMGDACSTYGEKGNVCIVSFEKYETQHKKLG
jgi:hypothetical protein